MASEDSPEILLLLVRRRDTPAADFESAVTAAAARIGVDHETALLMSADALPALAHVSAPDPTLPDAVLTLRADADKIAAVAVDLRVKLATVLDADRSELLAVRRHAILPGGDAIRLVFGLRRLERLTLEQFHDYWLNHHAEMGRRLIPPYTYHQLHTDPETTTRLAARTGLHPATFDGVVEVHFPDTDAFVRQLSRQEVAEEALADERNFIDHSRSIFWAYRTV